MNMYEGALEFKGNWRTYQKRILDRAERYLEDGKIHIVAARDPARLRWELS